MPLTYIIESTDSSLSFILSPGEKDGFSGTQRNSDLTLQGYGVLSWGEDVNENLLRTLENHACLAKENGDYNPTSGLYDYTVGVDPLMPKSEFDVGFGPGKGINVPIYGQLWFNKSDDRMYEYTQNDEWVNVSGVPTVMPINPNNGDLWYDEAIPQLKLWDGLTWISVADRYVLRSGDAMHGQLSLVTTEGGSTPSVPLNDEHATNKLYVDSEITIRTVEASGDTMTGFLTLHSDPVNLFHAATKQYVDNEIIAAEYVEKAGDTMTGDLWMVDGADVVIVPDVTGYGGLGIFPVTGGGATIQLMTSDVFNGAVLTAPPMIEFFNNQNHAPTGGASGTWGWSRWCPRDGLIMRLEADLDPNTLGANTETIFDVLQTGRMDYYGIPGGGSANVIRTPSATIAHIGTHSKNLTTREYVDDAVNTGINSISSGPIFLSPSTFATGHTSNNWVTINAQSHGVPNGANTVIIDFTMSRGEGGGLYIQLRNPSQTSRNSQATLTTMYVSGGHDGSFTHGGHAMCPLNGSEQFAYRINGGGVNLRVIGYFI